MSDTDQNPQMDLDTLTDDQVRKLGPDEVQALMEQEGQEDVTEETSADELGAVSDTSGSNDLDSDSEETNTETVATSEGEPETNPVESEAEEATINIPGEETSTENPGEPSTGEAENKKETDKDHDSGEDGEKKAKAANNSQAEDFMSKITAPFKADGQTMQVRSAEDAIRLMQMGVNYSRRMQEMKPLKAQDAMLKQHGLDNPETLSYLIDLAEGKPDAIQKLLKEKNIDPLDIDISKDSNYRVTDYSPDTKDLDFKEAIQTTLAAPHGQTLINDVNAMWDDSSKEALRDHPQIFNNLLDQMNSGVYDRIKGEVHYQRTLGHLANVPFLQAYHQVGDAMQKAGVWDKPQDQSGGLAPLQAAKPEPIDTGVRKAAEKPKTEQPNPNLSSTPRNVPSNSGITAETDYSSMSDDDFLKLGVPG